MVRLYLLPVSYMWLVPTLQHPNPKLVPTLQHPNPKKKYTKRSAPKEDRRCGRCGSLRTPEKPRVGCEINQGQAPALLVAPSRAPRHLLARLQAWPMRSELGAALARCSADIGFSVVWLRCASAQSIRVRLGAIAGEYGRVVMMSKLAPGLRSMPKRFASPGHCSTRDDLELVRVVRTRN